MAKFSSKSQSEFKSVLRSVLRPELGTNGRFDNRVDSKSRIAGRIEIIAPGSSSKVSDVQQAIQNMQALGYEIQFDEKIFSDHPYLSQNDEKRFQHLESALQGAANILWCSRGGYGCLRLMPYLAKIKKPKKLQPQKWLVGYSDITSLHLFLNHFWKMPTIHGSVFEAWGVERVDKNDLQETLLLLHLLTNNKKARMSYPLQPMNFAAEKTKKITGMLTGGNLAVLTSHLGTPYIWSSGKKILMLEDIGERGYRLDRYLNQLKMSSIYKTVQAIVFGQFTGGNEVDGKNHVGLALTDFVETTKVPCFRSTEFGHGTRNRPLVFGSTVDIYKNEMHWSTSSL